MFEDKPSSSASGSPEPISCFELCQPERVEKTLGLRFFWKDDIMKGYSVDGTMRDATSLSVKLFINLIKEIPAFSPGLVGRMLHGPWTFVSKCLLSLSGKTKYWWEGVIM